MTLRGRRFFFAQVILYFSVAKNDDDAKKAVLTAIVDSCCCSLLRSPPICFNSKLLLPPVRIFLFKYQLADGSRQTGPFFTSIKKSSWQYMTVDHWQQTSMMTMHKFPTILKLLKGKTLALTLPSSSSSNWGTVVYTLPHFKGSFKSWRTHINLRQVAGQSIFGNKVKMDWIVRRSTSSI